MSENYGFAEQKRMGEHANTKINLPAKHKHDKCSSTLGVRQPTRSTALYPEWQQPYEAMQLGGVAQGHSPSSIHLSEVRPSNHACCSFGNALGYKQAGSPSSLPPQHPLPAAGSLVRTCSQGIEAAQRFARLSLCNSEATDTLP